MDEYGVVRASTNILSSLILSIFYHYPLTWLLVVGIVKIIGILLSSLGMDQGYIWINDTFSHKDLDLTIGYCALDCTWYGRFP